MARTLPEQRVESNGCRLQGTVVLLWLSRACGVAPVTFERQRSSIIARVSRKYAYIAFVFALIMGVLIFAALLLDVSFEVAKNEHHRYNLARSMINCINYLMTIVVIILAVARGPARTERFLSYCMKIQQINIGIGNKPMSSRLEKLLRALVAGGVALVVVACATNVVASTREVLFYQKKWTLHIIQKLMYISHLIASLLILQITFIITQALWTLKALNRSITRLQASIQFDGASSEADSALVETIRWQSNTYASIFDIVHQINATEGLMMLLLLLDCVFRFSSVAFFITLQAYTSDTSWLSIHAAAQATHFVRVCFVMVLLVEPCHRTHGELRKTQELISRALCELPSALHAGSAALARFHAATEPYRYVYTPMGTFKFSSSVYTAVIGGLISLIIIIVRI